MYKIVLRPFDRHGRKPNPKTGFTNSIALNVENYVIKLKP